MSAENATLDQAPFIEKLLFAARPLIIVLFALATVFLAWQATQLKLSASFEKNIPTEQAYIINFLQNREDLRGLGNTIRIAVEASKGDIFTEYYLDALKQLTDETFYIPGVDRSGLKSLWTPNVRWSEVTEEGLAGGEVIPSDYDGSDESISTVRKNVLRSGQIGRLIANDFKSTIIHAPLLETNPNTGEQLDYQALSTALEEKLRDKYQSDSIKVHISGFAKVVGDLIDGASQVVLFFAVAVLITLLMLFWYCRCIGSTVLTMACSIIAVVWQLGILNLLGQGLDPYSMLIPFLVFAIAVSHGVQFINATAHARIGGAGNLLAARLAFRGLYIAGLTALISDGFGFATLLVIQIEVIHELAIAASVGIAAILLINLMLLPVCLSYAGVSDTAVDRLQEHEARGSVTWKVIANFTQKPWSTTIISLALLVGLLGVFVARDLQIGDLDKGAPELHPDSRYNVDNAYITSHYSASTDVLVVMVKTAKEQCISYSTLAAVDHFQWQMENVPGVQMTQSLVDRAKYVIGALNEGNLKWMTLSRNQYIINGSMAGQTPSSGLFNSDCSMLPVLLFLEDHKAKTLSRVIAAVELFNHDTDTGETQFLLAAGNAGIEAATNIVVMQAQTKMLIWVYAVVALLVLITFRSWRTVLCVITPLILTSILCQALMVTMNIGVKVATLPVIALGVGIGVDYGIYIYSKLESLLKKGVALQDAYYDTLKTTGKAVVFTGLTLAIGVATWAFSPIKFQADMGILLTFMFLSNMLGATLLIPALACYLLPKQNT